MVTGLSRKWTIYLPLSPPSLFPMLTNTQTTQAIHPIVSDTQAHTALERQVNDYADLVYTDPTTGLTLLQKLRDVLEGDATDVIRFRVASNIAACQFELGEKEVAAKGFIAAYGLDPGNPKAVENKALGLLLQDDWPSLKVFAETELLEFPDNATLAAYYIQGSAVDMAITDPLAHVPEVVRGTPRGCRSPRAMARGPRRPWRLVGHRVRRS